MSTVTLSKEAYQALKAVSDGNQISPRTLARELYDLGLIAADVERHYINGKDEYKNQEITAKGLDYLHEHEEPDD